MTKTQALKALKSGKFFTAVFTKEDGTSRKLNGRYGVKKHLKGGSKGYDSDALGLVTVYENGNGYRSIPIQRLKTLNGKKVG